MNSINKIPISVVIPVKNEERNLPLCLEKLASFSEVVIVDSQSTDRTAEIVNSFGFKLINFKWNGHFPKKRNWTLRNVNLKNDWVLFLDADEFLTQDFIDEISIIIKSTKHKAFWLSYNNHFMGKELKYGDKMRKLAFFNKNFGEYEKIEEDSWSHLDMEIHEHPIIEGTKGKIKCSIIHDDYNGLDHYISKHNAYSTWEANRYKLLKRDDFKNLTFKQKIKYSLISKGLLPFIYFYYSYFLKLGFLDGKSGYYFAKYKSNYFFQIQTKIKVINS